MLRNCGAWSEGGLRIWLWLKLNETTPRGWKSRSKELLIEKENMNIPYFTSVLPLVNIPEATDFASELSLSKAEKPAWQAPKALSASFPSVISVSYTHLTLPTKA